MDEYRIVLAPQTVYKLTFSNIAPSGVGVTDGDKGDVRVSGGGTIWEVDHYVKEVIEVANFAALPGTGALKTLYKTLNNGNYFEWNGTAYIAFTGVPPYYFVPGINIPNGVAGINELGQIEGLVSIRHDTAANLASVVFNDGELAYELDAFGLPANIRFGDGVTAGGRQIENYRAKKFTEGVQTMPDLSANVNSWSPAQDGSGIWRLNPTVAVDITGIANTAVVSELWNISTTTNITLKHFSTSSGTPNRFRCPGNVDFVMTPGTIAIIRRDTASFIWRVK